MSNRPSIVIGPARITSAKAATEPVLVPTRAAMVADSERQAQEVHHRIRDGRSTGLRMDANSPAPESPGPRLSAKEQVASERARSARQAEIAHARGRMAQEKANPGLIAATTWVVDPSLTAETDEDGADYVVPASARRPDDAPPISGPQADQYVNSMVDRVVHPGSRLSTSKMEADRDTSRGVGRIEYDRAEVDAMSPFHKNAIRNGQRYTCRVCGGQGISVYERSLCDKHVGSGLAG